MQISTAIAALNKSGTAEAIFGGMAFCIMPIDVFILLLKTKTQTAAASIKTMPSPTFVRYAGLAAKRRSSRFKRAAPTDWLFAFMVFVCSFLPRFLGAFSPIATAKNVFERTRHKRPYKTTVPHKNKIICRTLPTQAFAKL